MVNKNNRNTYFEIGNRKFDLEKCNDNLYEITMFENDKFGGTWVFGSFESALAEILSYAEISNEDYNADHDCITFTSDKKGE